MVATERITFRVDSERMAWLERWGGGNATVGVRYAIDRSIESESEGMDPRRRLLDAILLPENAVDKGVYVELMELTLKDGEDESVSIRSNMCTKIETKHTKKSRVRRKVLDELTDQSFLGKDYEGYYIILRSNHKVSDEALKELRSDFRDYLCLEGKYANQIKV